MGCGVDIVDRYEGVGAVGVVYGGAAGGLLRAVTVGMGAAGGCHKAGIRAVHWKGVRRLGKVANFTTTAAVAFFTQNTHWAG
jgi:hypothetical protein